MYPRDYMSHIMQWRILVPSSTAPPSSGQPGIWRRKSATGGVDAQGNLLVHPMVSLPRNTAQPSPCYSYSCIPLSQTWLDERLFGWSRSARRGTSAWAGSRSHEVSRAATPDVSDEEDAPDYDDFLNVPGGGDYSLASRPRSQRSSYADLQRLRAANGSGVALQPLSPAIATTSALADDEANGLHFRGGPQNGGGGGNSGQGGATHGSPSRPRKPSLSDNVPVEVIGQVDREEPFRDATTDLNAEMKKRRESSSGRSG